MHDRIQMRPCGPIRGTIRPPGSKSLTNRALACAALAAGTSTLCDPLYSEDTEVMIDSLGRLGIAIERQEQGRRLVVAGCGGRLPAGGAELFVANSGTTMRFLTALVALGHGTFRLDGTPRMRQRPIADLLEALGQLGVAARSETGSGCPPVVVEAAGIRGGRAAIRGDVSSQFLSGLLIASPCAAGPVEIEVVGPLVSQPYVQMTIAVMQAFGATIEREQFQRFRIPAPQTYRAIEYPIEPDATAASYFWAAAAITGGRVTVEGLSRNSLQGDVAFCRCLQQMGCDVEYGDSSITVAGRPLHGVSVDMNAISDTVQTLAAVALFADGPTTITGVAHIRHKESDRIGDLARELRKLGARVDELPDGLRIEPRPLHGADIETYNDHRMAMSLSLVGLRVPGVTILNPACTEKTYPRFFDDLQQLIDASDRPAQGNG